MKLLKQACIKKGNKQKIDDKLGEKLKKAQTEKPKGKKETKPVDKITINDLLKNQKIKTNG